MALDTPIHTNEQSIDRVLRAGRPVILVFWRHGCAPCEQLDPALHRLAAAYANKALIAKVDVRDNPALARRSSSSNVVRSSNAFSARNRRQPCARPSPGTSPDHRVLSFELGREVRDEHARGHQSV